MENTGKRKGSRWRRVGTFQVSIITFQPVGIPLGWKTGWLPRGTDGALQRALKVLGEINASPSDPNCLGIKEICAEIRYLAYWHNAENEIVADFPKSSLTRDSLNDLCDAISKLKTCIDVMPEYGWEKLNQSEWPSGTIYGWKDIAQDAVGRLVKIEPNLQSAILSVSNELSRGQGNVMIERYGAQNLHLVQRTRALLACCNKPYGSTNEGYLERLSAAIKTYATGNEVGDTALRKYRSDACHQDDTEFHVMIAECQYRSAQLKFSYISPHTSKARKRLEQRILDVFGLSRDTKRQAHESSIS